MTARPIRPRSALGDTSLSALLGPEVVKPPAMLASRALQHALSLE